MIMKKKKKTMKRRMMNWNSYLMYCKKIFLLQMITKTKIINKIRHHLPLFRKHITYDVLIGILQIESDLLSEYGHNFNGVWGDNEKRGGRDYIPPRGWVAYGLNVLGKYDNGNNDWLACNGRPGEWCVAYHGLANGQSSDNVKKVIALVLHNNLKPGAGQACKGYNNDNPNSKVRVGVYCSPNPIVIDGYAGQMQVNGHSYSIAFMLRVKPDKIRYANEQKDYWVLNGNFDEIRPYILLIKKMS